MKNKFYTSLLIGVGLVIASTSSYAKPAHASAKKSPAVVAKPGRKHSVIAVKQSEPRVRPTASAAATKHAQARVPQHSAALKHAAFRPSSHALIPAKHPFLRPQAAHTLRPLLSQLKRGHAMRDVPYTQKRLFNHRRTPNAGRRHLETIVPPLVTIPHIPSNNQFLQTEADDDAQRQLAQPAEWVDQNPLATPETAEMAALEPLAPANGAMQASFSNNSFAEPSETNTRIHSFLPNRQPSENIDNAPPVDNGPHDYTTTHGVITSSLADAGMEAGLSEALTDQLTHIFAWDIDFATNLHVGDEFTVLYESGTDGEQIIAAEFVTEGRVMTAVRYQDRDGNVNYYTPEGKAMRKAFLSTPVDYARITSHFNANRRHPILNRIRAHKGVDYAARIGTPVKAAGDGTVTFMGRKGGYGQVVILQHGEHFETVYAHLSDFGRSLLEGDSVSQGDVIGYVGQTGLATGPHLHYEFRVDGVHRNPETVSSGASRNEMALNGYALRDFKDQTKVAVAQLYSAKAKSLFAKNQPNYR